MEAWISGWTKKCEASKLLGDVSMDEDISPKRPKTAKVSCEFETNNDI